MGAFYPIGTYVRFKSGEHSGVDLTGKTGRVHAHFDMAATKDDITHNVWLGEFGPRGWVDQPIMVPDGKENPFAFGPAGPLPHRIHGETMPHLQVDRVEVPASVLEAV